jgi:hypothetical protein
LPALPAPPPSVIVERWLPYEAQKRRVIHVHPTEPDVVYEKVRNVIIQWETAKAVVHQEFKDLGVVRADPQEYLEKYGSSLKRLEEMPDFVRDFKTPSDLLPKTPLTTPPELEGDLYALTLIDLDREGLSEYKHLLSAACCTQPCSLRTKSMVTFAVAPEVMQPTTSARSVSQSVLSTCQTSESAAAPVENKNVRELLNEIVESIKGQSKSRLTYNEAKSVIAQLNLRLLRVYDDEKADKFLESINLTKESSCEVETFKAALLSSV